MDHLHRKRVALIGSSGMLAQAVKKTLPATVSLLELDLPGFDMTDPAGVRETLRDFAPDIIVNCAAYTNVDGCESEEELATRVNGTAVGYLAEAATGLGAVLVHVSTDYVFAGDKAQPYSEEDPTGPVSAYGRSKLCGEQAILESGLEAYFIVRTSWLYGSGGKNFVETIRRLASEREELRIVSDQVGTPTFTEDLAVAIVNLLATQAFGVYHFANEGNCSWFDFASEIVRQLRVAGAELAVKHVVPIRTEEYPLPAVRPAYSVFSKEKYKQVTGAAIPAWQDALSRYLSCKAF